MDMNEDARSSRQFGGSQDEHVEVPSLHLQPSDALTQPHRTALPRKMSRLPVEPGSARKMSVFRRLSIASHSSRDYASSVLGGTRKHTKLENTYKMAPDDDKKFNSSRMEKMVTDILNSYLDGEDYEPKKCSQLAKNLSDVIKSRVKDIDLDRYKIVTNVTIGENGDHGLQYASRCLWSTTTDNYACATYKNGTLFCVVNVYALYHE